MIFHIILWLQVVSTTVNNIKQGLLQQQNVDVILANMLQFNLNRNDLVWDCIQNMPVFIFHFIAWILFEIKVQEASKLSDIHFTLCLFLTM